MRIKILTISERQPEWVNLAYADYAKRLPAHLSPELVELPLAKRREDVARAKIDEAQRLLSAVPKSGYIIAMDEHAQNWSSMQLSEQLARWLQLGQDVAFLIGGPDGLHSDVLSRAAQRWSISRLTFPHGLVRIILVEQLYRAHSILAGHPYHRR